MAKNDLPRGNRYVHPTDAYNGRCRLHEFADLVGHDPHLRDLSFREAAHEVPQSTVPVDEMMHRHE